MESLNSDVAKEVLTILLYSGKYIQDSIPDEIYKKLTSLAASSTLDIVLLKDKDLKDQNLSEDALDLFSLLYYKYVATPLEKDEIISNWKMNDKID